MSKMGEYAASLEDMQVPGGMTIGACEIIGKPTKPIEAGTMVYIPGLGEAQIQKALPYGNYEVVTTDIKIVEGRQTNVFIVKPVQSIKWYIVKED